MKSEKTIYIVDDEEPVREALALLARSDGLQYECFASAQAFLNALDRITQGCLLLDVFMPDMSGLELQKILLDRRQRIPIIILTGHADVPTAVEAMKNGAADFIEKPFIGERLLERIHHCLNQNNKISKKRYSDNSKERRQANACLSSLTRRERDVMKGLVAGKRNREIAKHLFISPRTVEVHRANLMKKLGATSLSEVIRIAILANSEEI